MKLKHGNTRDGGGWRVWAGGRGGCLFTPPPPSFPLPPPPPPFHLPLFLASPRSDPLSHGVTLPPTGNPTLLSYLPFHSTVTLISPGSAIFRSLLPLSLASAHAQHGGKLTNSRGGSQSDAGSDRAALHHAALVACFHRAAGRAVAQRSRRSTLALSPC